MIKIRQADIGDCEMTYVWRNTESTRRYFFNPKAITLEEHHNWMDSVLKDDNRFLLIAFDDDTPVGVIRFDCIESVAEISIYLDPEKTGCGYGKQLIVSACEWGKRNLKFLSFMEAKILNENIASIKSFESVGFRKKEDETTYVLELHK